MLLDKIEWEGDDGIDWFDPSEVPEDLEDLWKDTQDAKDKFDSLFAELYRELEERVYG